MDNEIVFSDDFMPAREIDTEGKIFVPVYEWDLPHDEWHVDKVPLVFENDDDVVASFSPWGGASNVTDNNDGSFTLETIDSKSVGIRAHVDASKIETGTPILFSYELKLLDGEIYIIGGNTYLIRGTNITFIDGDKQESSHDDGAPYTLKVGEKIKVSVFGVFERKEGDLNIYIQPNRKNYIYNFKAIVSNIKFAKAPAYLVKNIDNASFAKLDVQRNEDWKMFSLDNKNLVTQEIEELSPIKTDDLLFFAPIIGDSSLNLKRIELGNLEPIQVQSLTLPKQLYRLWRKQSVTLTPEILPADAYDKTLTWESSNEEIAKVNGRGVVIGIGLGTCEITATSVNGVKGATKVEVYDGSILHQCPMVNASGEAEYRIKELQFGDGYPQRAPDGINIDLRSYNLEFKGDNEYVQELDDFFTRHSGVKSFKWTAPDRSDQRKYVCRALKQRFINAKMRSLTVEIKESLI